MIGLSGKTVRDREAVMHLSAYVYVYVYFGSAETSNLIWEVNYPCEGAP